MLANQGNDDDDDNFDDGDALDDQDITMLYSL